MTRTTTTNTCYIPKKPYLKEDLTSSCAILDVGYNTGGFLKLALQYEYKPYGIEVNKYAIKQSPWIQNISWDEVGDIDFKLVSFFDSLEHMRNLEVLRSMRTAFILVSFPDVGDRDIEALKTWKHYRPNEHLFYFNRYTLKGLMNNIGYDLIVYENVEGPIREDITTGIFKKGRENGK